MKLDQLAAYALNDVEPPRMVLAVGPRGPVVDYLPLMGFNNTRQGTKRSPSLTLDGVAEGCQRLAAEHQQNQVILAMRRSGRPLSLSDHWLALTSTWRPVDVEENLLCELEGRRGRMADYLGINLNERHWPGHQSGTRPDFARLDRALGRALDVEVDHATGKLVQIVHAGDFFHSGSLPRR